MRCLVLLLALLISACASRASPPSSPGDCVLVEVWSNGWHTNLVFSADALPAEHPLRLRFPEARRFLTGWGERDFYREESPGMLTGVRAALLPTRSVMQVIAGDEAAVVRYWAPSERVVVALSRAGMERLAAELAGSLVLDAAGRPVEAPADRGAEAGVFLEARPSFHLFHMCNHWTAARLSAAGVRIEPRWAFHAPWLMAALARKAPDTCPAPG